MLLTSEDFFLTLYWAYWFRPEHFPDLISTRNQVSAEEIYDVILRTHDGGDLHAAVQDPILCETDCKIIIILQLFCLFWCMSLSSEGNLSFLSLPSLIVQYSQIQDLGGSLTPPISATQAKFCHHHQFTPSSTNFIFFCPPKPFMKLVSIYVKFFNLTRLIHPNFSWVLVD